MSDVVRTFLGKHAAATSTESRDYPDVFEGTAALILELELALFEASEHAKAIRCARAERSIDKMKAAHAGLDRVLSQAKSMADTLGTVIGFHHARKDAPGHGP